MRSDRQAGHAAAHTLRNSSRARVKVAEVFATVCVRVLCRFPAATGVTEVLISSVSVPPSRTSPVSAFTAIPRETRRFNFFSPFGLSGEGAITVGLNVAACRAWARAVMRSSCVLPVYQESLVDREIDGIDQGYMIAYLAYSRLFLTDQLFCSRVHVFLLSLFVRGFEVGLEYVLFV